MSGLAAVGEGGGPAPPSSGGGIEFTHDQSALVAPSAMWAKLGPSGGFVLAFAAMIGEAPSSNPQPAVVLTNDWQLVPVYWDQQNANAYVVHISVGGSASVEQLSHLTGQPNFGVRGLFADSPAELDAKFPAPVGDPPERMLRPSPPRRRWFRWLTGS